MFEQGLEFKVFRCDGDGADCFVPCEAERCATERSTVRVREECKCHHFCKYGRTAGQGNLDGNKDRAKDFRFYGSPNYVGGGECNNMPHCYTDTLPANNFLVFFICCNLFAKYSSPPLKIFSYSNIPGL